MTSPAWGPDGRSVLYRGGRVYSPADPHATAMLVSGEAVVWVGSESDTAPGGPAADATVELDGALVTPAFVDAHVHTTMTGLVSSGPALVGCGSAAAVLDAVAAHAGRLPADAVVLGQGWEESRWDDAALPGPDELHRAAGGRTVYLGRVEGHSALVSPDLVAVARGEDGWSASGWLRTDAHHTARRTALSGMSTAQRTDLQRRVRADAAALGIGALHECGGPQIGGEDDFTGLLALAAAEPGPLVFGYWGELGGAAKARDLGAAGAGGDLFCDGALGAGTAALREPYADAAQREGDAAGRLYLTGEQIAAHVVDCVRAGVPAGFHAIGDRALDAALTAGFPAAAARVGLERLRSRRHRIEHAEMLDQRQVRAMVTYGLVASVQPAFDAAWGGPDGLYARRLGVDRALTLNPFAQLAGVGVPMAFGSDSPVTPLDPWGAVRAAAYHRGGHRIPVRAGFAAHTRGGWRAVDRDGAGVLAPGAPATFAVWADERDERDDEPAGGPRVTLPSLRPGAPAPTCLRTVVRGVPVYASDGTVEGVSG
jgi:predicted amidohydrolase YtcJ